MFFRQTANSGRHMTHIARFLRFSREDLLARFVLRKTKTNPLETAVFVTWGFMDSFQMDKSLASSCLCLCILESRLNIK